MILPVSWPGISGSACAGKLGKEPRGSLCIRVPSRLLTAQPSFLFPGSVSCRGSPVPGFPGGPNPAQRVASNAAGPLSLSLSLLIHPSRRWEIPLPVCFRPEILPHPSGQTGIGWERAAARSRVLRTGWEPGLSWAAQGAGSVAGGSAPRSEGSPHRDGGGVGGSLPSLTPAEPPRLCAPAAEPSSRRAGGPPLPPPRPGSRCPEAPPAPAPGVHQPVPRDEAAFSSLPPSREQRPGR